MSERIRYTTEAGLTIADGPHSKALQRQQDIWQAGKRVTVEDLVAAFPELAFDLQALFDLVRREVLHRDSRRESPTLGEYSRRFPALGNRLAELFPRG